MLRFSFISLFILLIVVGLDAQLISVNSTSLKEAIRTIENNSDFTFNYQDDVISSQKLPFPFALNMDYPEVALTKLLRSTRIDFEIQGDLIYILPPKLREYNITGLLVDTNEKSPLGFAHVYMSNHQGTFSNEAGNFDLQVRAYKNDKVNISYLGYDKLLLQCSDFTEALQLEMSPSSNWSSEEVIVRDYLLSSITQDQAYMGVQLNLNGLHRELGSIDRDVLRSVQLIPGISSLDESSANINIRGYEAEQNLLVWENAPFYGRGHLMGMISSINPFIVDNVSVQKGAFDPSYDNRIGGIVDISLTEEIEDQWHLGVGTSATEAHFETSIPLFNRKAAIIISGRKALNKEEQDNPAFQGYTKRAFSSTAFNDDDEKMESDLTSGVNLDYDDINAKLIVQPSKEWKFTSSFFNSKSHFHYEYMHASTVFSGSDQLDEISKISSNALSYNWSDSSTTTLRANFSFYENKYSFSLFENNSIEASSYKFNENEIYDFQIKANHCFRLSNVKMNVGYIMDRKILELEVVNISNFEKDINAKEHKEYDFHHVYANSNWAIQGWHVDLGLRSSMTQNKLFLSPRFSLSKSLVEGLNFNIGIGYFDQFIKQVQNFSESNLNLENRLWIMDIENVMQSTKGGLGLNYLVKGWLFDFQVYANTSSGVSILTTGQSSALQINQDGQMFSRGTELLVKKRWNHLNSALAYHLSFVTLDIPVFDDAYFPSNNDQRHNLSWMNTWHQANWSIGINYNFRSGLPYTETGEIQLVQDDDEDHYEVKVRGINDERLEPLHRFDLFLGYEVPLKSRSLIEFQLSLYNIFGSSAIANRSSILTNLDDSNVEPEIFEVKKNQLNRTPQFLIRYSF